MILSSLDLLVQEIPVIRTRDKESETDCLKFKSAKRPFTELVPLLKCQFKWIL